MQIARTLGFASGLLCAIAGLGFVPARTLLDSCANGDAGPTWYVAGTLDEAQRHPDALPYCLPQGLTATMLRDIACHYLLAHEELDRYPAASVVSAALTEAFPCMGIAS